EPLVEPVELVERGSSGGKGERQRKLKVSALAVGIADILLVGCGVESECDHRPPGFDVPREELIGSWKCLLEVKEKGVDVGAGPTVLRERRLHILLEGLVEQPRINRDGPGERAQRMVHSPSQIAWQHAQETGEILVAEL